MGRPTHPRPRRVKPTELGLEQSKREFVSLGPKKERLQHCGISVVRQRVSASSAGRL